MTNDTATYRAVQAVAPGQLQLTTKPLREPPPGYVRIRVEACGVCHSDAGTVAGTFPISWPRVPGHEVIGRIDTLGEGVQGWSMGQRVGVGFLAGSCGYCSACRAGDLVHCENQEHRASRAPLSSPSRVSRIPTIWPPNIGRHDCSSIHESTPTVDFILGADDHLIGIAMHSDEALGLLDLPHKIIDGLGGLCIDG